MGCEESIWDDLSDTRDQTLRLFNASNLYSKINDQVYKFLNKNLAIIIPVSRLI